MKSELADVCFRPVLLENEFRMDLDWDSDIKELLPVRWRRTEVAMGNSPGPVNVGIGAVVLPDTPNERQLP